MLKADLHIHTTASDGVYTPSKVVLRAKEKGVQLLAVTDHDAVSGLAEAKAVGGQLGIQILPGVELSAGGKAEVHILGYGIDENNGELNDFLMNVRNERVQRAAKIIQKLTELGLPIEIPHTEENASVGRPLIARAMMTRGYVRSVQEAFEKYLGSGCPAYVPRRKLDVTEAIALLKRVGAIPVLAHPSQIRMDEKEVLTSIESWIDTGLMGIEIYHHSMYFEHRQFWGAFAEKRGLLITGGSDFHALGDKHADIGAMMPYWNNCSEDAERLLLAVDQVK